MAIVSFSRNFIFVKTRKTAGSSMEVFLSAHCEGRDIVTPINPPSPDHRPRNCGRAGLYYAHMHAAEIRSLHPKLFRKAFTFCFERHPVDKCLSQFAMWLNAPYRSLKKDRRPKTWAAYLVEGRFPVDTPRYVDGEGRLLVDRVYRYEDLDGALRDIQRRVGLPSAGPLPREKSGFRSNVPTFAEVMARPAERDLIMEAFADTLRHVDY